MKKKKRRRTKQSSIFFKKKLLTASLSSILDIVLGLNISPIEKKLLVTMFNSPILLLNLETSARTPLKTVKQETTNSEEASEILPEEVC